MRLLSARSSISTGAEEALEPLHRALGVPLELIVVVHEVEPEPGRVPGRPLPVVQQRPREVARHPGAVGDGALQLVEVLVEVVDPEGVVERVRQRVAALLVDPVLADEDQGVPELVLHVHHRLVEPPGHHVQPLRERLNAMCSCMNHMFLPNPCFFGGEI